MQSVPFFKAIAGSRNKTTNSIVDIIKKANHGFSSSLPVGPSKTKARVAH